ncbi:TRAP transporter small permease subunit [Ponticoccus gilvus]|nr:TRAP transporter small permease subunit [Enemella evansiae]
MRQHTQSTESLLRQVLQRLDQLNWSLAGAFLWASNLCLLAMLCLTTATIVLRPFGLAIYWIWPWTMVFFIWLSFFGFFALYARLKDIRIDFIAHRLGPVGMAATRIIADFAALFLAALLLMQVPMVLATSTGVHDGAVLPSGGEVPRLFLSLPLFLSTALVAITALIDLAKMSVGLPENTASSHLEL